MKKAPDPIVDLKRCISICDWSPASMRRTRRQLGLTVEQVANALDVSPPSIRKLESGGGVSASLYKLYGMLLERYYAITKGYIPAYRKIGENKFMSEMDARRGLYLEAEEAYE